MFVECSRVSKNYYIHLRRLGGKIRILHEIHPGARGDLAGDRMLHMQAAGARAVPMQFPYKACACPCALPVALGTSLAPTGTLQSPVGASRLPNVYFWCCGFCVNFYVRACNDPKIFENLERILKILK